jgi:hypothetical protein
MGSRLDQLLAQLDANGLLLPVGEQLDTAPPGIGERVVEDVEWRLVREHELEVITSRLVVDRDRECPGRSVPVEDYGDAVVLAIGQVCPSVCRGFDRHLERIAPMLPAVVAASTKPAVQPAVIWRYRLPGSRRHAQT